MSKSSDLGLFRMDSTSSTLLDVQHFEDIFFLFTEPDCREEYDEYNLNLSLSSILPLNIMLLILCIPFLALIALHWDQLESKQDQINWILSTSFVVFINILVWVVYFHHQRKRTSTGTLPRSSKIFLGRFQMAVFLLVDIMVCSHLAIKVSLANCNLTMRDGDGNCNTLADAHAIPQSTSIVVMLLPILYTVFDRGTHFPFSVMLWLLSLISLIFSAAYVNAYNSIAYIVYYSAGSCLLLIECRRVNIHLFVTHRKLQQILKQREKDADAANAQELRHMIANVAHDLKTPLSSFLSGIEFISHVVSDITAKQVPGKPISAADIEDCIQSVNHCVTNMRNTNSFMLMTINRCIDYTKASKGVKLVPRHETVDLLEAISLPLSCMKDIQQRVPITLEPIARQICTHIITDKQWLQENVLCLLSNAVKYSNAGVVTLAVTVLKLDEQDVLRRIRERNSTEEVEQREARVRGTRASRLGWQTLHLGRVYHDKLGEDTTAASPVTGDAPSTSVADLLPLEHRREEGEARLVDYLRVEVEDHGIGLSEEAMGSLFSPFKQAQRLAGGTGLGLFSLAKRIEALDGFCGVQKRRDGDEGSLFWFEIPYRPDNQSSKMFTRYFHALRRVPSNDPPTHVASHHSSGSGGTCASSSCPPLDLLAEMTPQDGWQAGGTTTAATLVELSMRSKSTEPSPSLHATGSLDVMDELQPLDILLVDDSPAILKMTSMMLKRHKHTVCTATNGAEAIKAISQRMEACGRGFDVVLMDLQMPVMDGLEATRRLRSMESLKPSTSPRQATPKAVRGGETGALCPEILQSLPSVDVYTGVIVGVSANSDAETTREAYKVGVDAFMAKPFSLETFYRTYDEVLARREVL